MRETFEFRIVERKAQLHLRPEDGTRIGHQGEVRKLVVDSNDIRAAKVARVHRQFRKEGSYFFLGWSIRRKYSPKELEAAELLRLCPRSAFEPCGEMCGTLYDDASGCPHCVAGARQLNELRLDPSSLPRGKDLARTIAYNEIIVSARLADAMRAHSITGARFLPVLHKNGRAPIEGWFQLDVTSRPLDILPPTHFGLALFEPDEHGEYLCPQGHKAGLNILSELSVRREDWDGSDVCATRQLAGYRSTNGGVFRPFPLLLVSQRLRRLFVSLKAKGFELEVAHLV